jgi:hypothetical protein
MGRVQRQATKIYRALGGDGNWLDGPPPKPKWMRWRTYDRLAGYLQWPIWFGLDGRGNAVSVAVRMISE